MYILKNHLYESHEPRREGLSLIFPLTYQRNSGTLQYVIVNKKTVQSVTNKPSIPLVRSFTPGSLFMLYFIVLVSYKKI